MKILLLDDEPLALRQLELYAGKTPGVEVVAACSSAALAREHLADADVLLVDINMPDINGLEFVRSLENPPLVVFSTAYAEYAVEGFRVNAVDYLLKPFSLSEFQVSMAKVQHRLDLERAAAPAQEDVLYFKTGYKNVPVNLSDIRYIEGMSEYVKIWVEGQKTPLVVLYSLKKLVDLLPSSRFMRIHRSYIIALDRIREATAAGVVLEGGVSLPVGDLYRAAFKDYIKRAE